MDFAFKQVVIDKLTHENALLKRLKFAAHSACFSAEQKSPLGETLDSDLETVLAGQRAAALISLIQSAKLGGHDPYSYLKDLPQRLHISVPRQQLLRPALTTNFRSERRPDVHRQLEADCGRPLPT